MQSRQLDLTMLFVDIEQSTLLVQKLGDSYVELILEYRKLMRLSVSQFSGSEVDVIGDGYFAVFSKPEDALKASLMIQEGMKSIIWPKNANVSARIGLHKGKIERIDNSYVGLDLHRASRIGDVGNGGQIILSQQTVQSIDISAFSQQCCFRNLGPHRLKGLRFPEMLWDVLISNHLPSSTKLRSIDNRPNNLPHNTIVLYGRTRELDQLRILITEQQTKLITITGAGGIGKTSIGIELAKNLLPLFSSGIFLVDLSGTIDPGLVIFEIIENLGIRESQEQNPLDFLCSYLKNTNLLLLIDNFEQVLKAKDVIQRLISACENLRIVITSREPLGLPLETVFRLDTLSLPSANDLYNLDKIATSPSVQLFVERSRQVVSNFELDKNNAQTIALICRQVEGLALAIEIAASRLKILTPQQILDRLSVSFSFLGNTGSPIERHKTVFSTVEWSYNMLNSAERNLLDIISVFRGGFLMDAVDFVNNNLDWLSIDILETLVSLVDKSLVRVSTVSGVRRFSLLEPIRQFAIQKLIDNGYLHEISDIVARHYLELAEEKSNLLQTTQQKYVMNCLFDEQENLRASLTWFFDLSSSELCRRLIYSLLWFWIGAGLFSEGIIWSKRGLALSQANCMDKDTAYFNDSLAWLHLKMGDWNGALPFCKAAHDLLEIHGDKFDIAQSKVYFGISSAITGNYELGARMMQAGLEISQAHKNNYGTALALIAIGEGLRSQGDFTNATSNYLKALELFQACDNVYWSSGVNSTLSFIYTQFADLDSAILHTELAWNIANEFDYPDSTALALTSLAGILLYSDEPEDAIRILGKVDSILHTIGGHLEPLDRVIYENYLNLAQAKLGNVDVVRPVLLQGSALNSTDINFLIIKLKMFHYRLD